MDMLIHKLKINNFFYQLFYIALCGSLFVLSFPPFNNVLCVILSVCGISYLILQSNNYKTLLCQALVLSFSISFIGCYWISYSSYYVVYNFFLAQLILIGFGFLYTIFLLPTFLLIFLTKNHKTYVVLISTWVAWCMFDVCKLYLLGGFPWFMVASIWDFDIYMLQIASIVGEIGLSIITYGLLILCFGLLLNLSIKVKIIFVIMLCVIIFICHCLGYYIIKKFDSNNNFNTTSIRLVQPNINQMDKQNFYKQNENFNKIVELAFSNISYNKKNIDYIVLPEVAFNIVLEDNKNLFNKLLQSIPQNSYLLTGTLREENNSFYNSFYILKRQETHKYKVDNFYDKLLLVPFGEYIPLSKMLPFINNFVGLSNLQSGDEQKIFNVKNHKFSVLICFEGVFPNKLNSSQIDWLLNISNEAWFNRSIEFKQNNSLLRFRSIEGGIPLVKVANTGESIVLDALGRITNRINPYTAQVLDIDLQLRKKNVVFSLLIHNFLLYCIIFMYIIIYLMLFIYNNKDFSYKKK